MYAVATKNMAVNAAVNKKYSKVHPISSDDENFRGTKGRNKKAPSSSSKRGNQSSKKQMNSDDDEDESDSDEGGSGRSKKHYNYDSDCSSSIHSDDRIIQEIRDKKERERNESMMNPQLIEKVVQSTKESGKEIGSTKRSVRNRQLREQIIEEVLANILPTLGNYDDHNKILVYRQEDTSFVKWLKFIGCMSMDVHDAVISGDFQEFQRTIKKLCTGPLAKPELLNEYNSQGMAPLSVAAKINDLDICAELIDYQAEIECPDELTGRTPLFHAVQNKNHDLVFLLLKYGANPNVADMQCITPLMVAASSDDYKSVKLLCKGNADVDLQDERGWSAVHYAVYGNAPRSLAILLHEGANRNLRDLNGKRPLTFAKFHDYGECISLLCKKHVPLA